MADLVVESSPHHPGWFSILIINKEKLRNVINEHKEDFQKVLQRSIRDGSQLIEEAKSLPLMDNILKEHQGLIGTVLGYGRDNAWLFFNASKSHTSVGSVWGEESDSFLESSEEPTSSLTDFYLLHYFCPSFAGNPNSSESIALKKEYSLTKQKVIKYYKDKDFLEPTLSLLAEYRS